MFALFRLVCLCLKLEMVGMDGTVQMVEILNVLKILEMFETLSKVFIAFLRKWRMGFA